MLNLDSAVETRFWTQQIDSSSKNKNRLITNEVTPQFLFSLSKSICYARKSRPTAESRLKGDGYKQ